MRRVDTIQRGGESFHYCDYGGRGSALIFLAGLGNSAHIFDTFAPRFTSNFHVLALTRRGFGESSQPRTGYDTATLVQDLAENLTALKIERAILVGHSIAGSELMHFAIRFPERTQALIFLDAAYDRSGFEKRLLQLALLDALPPAPPGPSGKEKESVAGYRQYITRTRGVTWPESEVRATQIFDAKEHYKGERTSGRISQAVMRGESRAAFSEIKAPTLSLYATKRSVAQDFPWIRRSDITQWQLHEQATRCENFQQQYESDQRKRFRKALPNADVEELPGASHYLFLSHPEQTEQRMRVFLSRVVRECPTP